jgi:hypothetical protein
MTLWPRCPAQIDSRPSCRWSVQRSGAGSDDSASCIATTFKVYKLHVFDREVALDFARDAGWLFIISMLFTQVPRQTDSRVHVGILIRLLISVSNFNVFSRMADRLRDRTEVDVSDNSFALCRIYLHTSYSFPPIVAFWTKPWPTTRGGMEKKNKYCFMMQDLVARQCECSHTSCRTYAQVPMVHEPSRPSFASLGCALRLVA